ncbi:hypothetical protein ACI0X9_003950 [Cronobacter turicensis]
MAKLKHQFRTKEENSAYEGLILSWPCADEISCKLHSMLTAEKQHEMLSVLQSAIAAYHQRYPFYMNDWERFAVFIIIAVNYVAQAHAGKLSFTQIMNACTLPRKMTFIFIEDTAKKLGMELKHA